MREAGYSDLRCKQLTGGADQGAFGLERIDNRFVLAVDFAANLVISALFVTSGVGLLFSSVVSRLGFSSNPRKRLRKIAQRSLSFSVADTQLVKAR